MVNKAEAFEWFLGGFVGFFCWVSVWGGFFFSLGGAVFGVFWGFLSLFGVFWFGFVGGLFHSVLGFFFWLRLVGFLVLLFTSSSSVHQLATNASEHNQFRGARHILESRTH